MVKVSINNGGSIEMTQQCEDSKINVDVLDSKGDVDYYYEINPEDLVMLLNYYQYRTDRGLEIF